MTQRRIGATQGPDTSTTPTSQHQFSGSRQCDAATAWWRRRRASDRCEPLVTGERDPWRSWRPEQLSPVQVDAAVSAAEHLQLLGTPGLFDQTTCQGMWRSGHRQLAAESFRLSQWEAS